MTETQYRLFLKQLRNAYENSAFYRQKFTDCGLSVSYTHLFAIGVCFFLPVLVTYLNTGTVPQFPSFIASGFFVLAALQSIFVGLTLDVLRQKDRHDFEMRLNDMQERFGREKKD